MVLVAESTAVAEQFRQAMAYLPRITGDWQAHPLFLSPPNIEAGATPRVAWSWPAGEAQQDLIDAYIASQGLTAQFQWLAALPEDWTPQTP